MDNSKWLLGNGRLIKFWEDAWYGEPLHETLNVNQDIYREYPQFVHDYIQNFRWHIPQTILVQYPALKLLAEKVTIPMEDKEHKLIWNHNSNGELMMRDSYTFKNQPVNTHNWAKLIWSKDIPPSKSILTWRLIHDKVPTNEKLQQRGCQLPSMCSLCGTHVETSFHLFFECCFAFKIWCWFASVLDSPLHFQSIHDIWSVCDRGWSPQCKVVIQATIVNIISTIWYNINQRRFHNRSPHWQLAINNIINAVNLSGNYTNKSSNSSVRDLIILKKFNVLVHPPKPTCIKEIIWSPPIVGWIKCNTDGASTATSSSCGGVFRDQNANFLSCFAENLGGGSAYQAKLAAIMRAVEIASQRNWRNIWIESDSTLVVMAFNKMSMIPCSLRNKWINCRKLLCGMNFVVTHIYREGNRCADKLASKGLDIEGVTIWMNMPDFINKFVIHDRLGMPNFRVSSG